MMKKKSSVFISSVFFLTLSSHAKDNFQLIIDDLKFAKIATDQYENWNKALLVGYKIFKKMIEQSDYFQSHDQLFSKEQVYGSIRPASEFIALMASHASDKDIAQLLDYLIKTAGPFGFRNQKASSIDRFIYEFAAKAAAEADPELSKTTYQSEQIQHAQAISKLQSNFLKNHPDPLEDQENKNEKDVLSKHLDVTFFLNTTRNERWKTLLSFVKNKNFFQPEKAELAEAHKKYLFLNDFMIVAFTLGLSPRLTKNGSFNYQTHLFEEWPMSNKQMEDAHNYVQVWFPDRFTGMGDGIRSPRVTNHLKILVHKSKSFLDVFQSRMWLSFLRMTSFWGQKFDSEQLKKFEPDWEKNWIDSPHNYLRMTRILNWLRIFKLDKAKNAFESYLTKVAKENAGNAGLQNSINNYWHIKKD